MASIVVPAGHAFWLRNAGVPVGVLDEAATRALPAPTDGYRHRADLHIEGGTIAAVAPPGSAPAEAGPDLEGRLVWPCFVDMHTHLDKSHSVARTPNPDGTFTGALNATAQDRQAYWTAEDVALRMEFSLRCAYAHGVAAIRTHLDSFGTQGEITWAVFCELRERWAGRIDLQGVALTTLDQFSGAGDEALAALVARSGGILGGVTRFAGIDHGAMPDIDAMLDAYFALAARHGLDVDLHVDETSDVEAFTLPHIAAAVLRNKFAGKVVCGHCCNLALQPPEAAAAAIVACADAGISIVSLPSANMYLQDREGGRTPRWRGVTLAHELKAAGVRFSIATDNCRDAFIPYGDNDTLDSFRFALRVSHLDHPYTDWAATITRMPAATMGLATVGRIAVGGPADLVIIPARSFDELVSRPQSDRIVLRAGKAIDTTPPDYAEMDVIVNAKPRATPGTEAQ